VYLIKLLYILKKSNRMFVQNYLVFILKMLALKLYLSFTNILKHFSWMFI